MPRITKTAALKVSLIGIVTVIAAEGLAGLSVGSLALISDAAHGAFDALSTIILLVATTLSLKPADEDHTYGHGKIEALGALIGGFTLLTLAVVIVIFGYVRFSSQTFPHPSAIGYAAAGYTLGIDVLRMVTLTLALKSGSLTVKANLYDAISDFFSTSLVLGALTLTSFGYPIGDVAVSLVLAALLTYLSIRLIHASALDLSDAVSGKLVKSILAEIRKTSDVLKTKELRVRRVGQTVFVDAVLAVSPYVGITDADTIAARIEANLTKLLGPSSIMIHLEPLEWNIPVELQVRNITSKVEGAHGLHNLSVTNVGGGLYVTMHVQVDSTLDLNKAHEIADSVEKGIKKALPAVRQVTVHLEPSIPETSKGKILDDKQLSETIRSIVESYPGIMEITSILIFSTGQELRVNVHCRLAGAENVGSAHELVSRIEDQIRHVVPTAIVTIDQDPARS